MCTRGQYTCIYHTFKWFKEVSIVTHTNEVKTSIPIKPSLLGSKRHPLKFLDIRYKLFN